MKPICSTLNIELYCIKKFLVETYEEALKAVKKLSREEYAYSTADEYTPQEKAEEIKCLIAKKSSEHVDVLIVPTMDEEIEDPDTVTNSRSSIIVPETSRKSNFNLP